MCRRRLEPTGMVVGMRTLSDGNIGEVVIMTVRPITPPDRSEWLRLLRGLHPESTDADHAPS